MLTNKVLAVLIVAALALICFPPGEDWQKPGAQVLGWVLLFLATVGLGICQLITHRR